MWPTVQDMELAEVKAPCQAPDLKGGRGGAGWRGPAWCFLPLDSLRWDLCGEDACAFMWAPLGPVGFKKSSCLNWL